MLLSQQQFDIIEAIVNGDSPTRYADMYAQIYAWAQSPEVPQNTAASNVEAWFGAAAQTNLGQGGASDFIRTYTAAQLELRQGGPISGIDAVLQNASNSIADAVFRDIEGAQVTIDGETYYDVPDVTQIGRQDAGETLASLSSFSSDPAIWSGNLLFLGLGVDEFWYETILEEPGDTYDLTVSAAAAVQAGFDTVFSGNFFSLTGLFFSQGSVGAVDGITITTAAAGATDDFFQNAYGSFGADGLARLFSDGLRVGSNGADILESEGLLAGDFIVNGGGGADFIKGSLGRDLLDGGDDEDTVSFFETAPVAAIIYSHSSVAQFSALVQVNPQSEDFGAVFDAQDQSALFNTEVLELSLGDDRLVVMSSDLDATNLSVVDGLGAGDEFDNDVIDLRYVDQGANADLDGNELSVGDLSISVFDFENVTGSNFNDEIQGDQKSNSLLGLGGKDTISGGSGSGAEDGVGDIIFGGSGDDVLSLEGDSAGVLWGGSGNDTITGNGNSEIWAGSGADVVHAQVGDKIVGRLTAEDQLLIDGFDVSGLDLGSSFVAQWVDGEYLLTTSNRSDQSGADFGIFVKINDDQSGFDGTLNSVSYQVSIVKNPMASGISSSLRVINDADRFEGGPKDGEYNSDFRVHEYSFSNVAEHAVIVSDFRPGDFGLFSNAFAFLDTQYVRVSTEQRRVLEWVPGEGYDEDDPEQQFAGEYVFNGQTAGTYSLNVFDNSAAIINGSRVNINDIPVGPFAEASDAYLAFEAFFEGQSEDTDGSPGAPSEFFGGSDDDAFTTPDTASFVVAGGGSDTVNAGAGSDTIMAGSGSDSASGGAGHDMIFGDIALSVGGLDELADGGSQSSASFDTLSGGLGNDTILGGAGADSIAGEDDDDALFGDGGDDTVDGGAGNDFVDGGEGNDVLSLGDGSDTVSLDIGEGADTVQDFDVSKDVLVLGGQVFDPKADDNGFIATDGQAGLTISHESDPNTSILLEGVTLAELVSGMPIEPDGIINGTEGDDTIALGFEDYQGDLLAQSGNDTIIGGQGNDLLSGLNGDDVYIFSAGDGEDTIYEGGSGTDKIVFAKRSVSEMSVAKIDGNYILSFDSGDKVTIENPTHWTRVVETVEFDDAVLTFEEVAGIATSAMQTDGDDIVDGFNGNDTIEGGLGNDVLSGRHGDDTFIFRIGDGQDTVNDQGSGNETLVFEGRVFADLSVARSGQDFVLSFANGDSVTIVNPSHWTREIENVTFDDGTFTFAAIVDVMTAASQTDGDDVIDAYNFDDVLIGGLGNDTISGRHGDDTFIFRAGDGQDVVTDNGNGNDSILFEGRDLADATITRAANQDYVFSFDNGDSVTIQNPTHWARIVENIIFDDGAFEFNDIAASVTAAEQTSGDDHVRGFSGADTIIGGTGNDLLQGQHGDDTFIFRAGDGQDTVSDGGSGTDVLVFEGRNFEDVTATQSGNDLILSFANGDSVAIESPTHWTRIIENVSFEDTGVIAMDDLFA